MQGNGISKVNAAKLGSIEALLCRPMPAPPVVKADSMNMLVQDICNGMGDCDIEEEDDVILTFESEQRSAIQQQVRDAAVRAKAKEQLGKPTMTVGYHHGHLNPLPSSWHYPEKMNMVQMITLDQMMSPFRR